MSTNDRWSRLDLAPGVKSTAILDAELIESGEQDSAGLGQLGHTLTGTVGVTAVIGMGGPHCIAKTVFDEDTVRSVVGSETKQLQRPSSVVGKGSPA